MLCGHKTIFTLNDIDSSQWIEFAIVNLALLIVVRLVIPLLRRFWRESTLFDQEMIRRLKRFYFAKFGPHFMARDYSRKTVILSCIYFGITFRWLFACTFLSNVSFFFAGLTSVVLCIELLQQFSRILLHFVEKHGMSGPNINPITGMPYFQPDLMGEAKRYRDTDSDSD